MRSFTRSLMLVPLLAAALATAPALAADKPAKKEAGFGAGKGAYLTKEELRVCLNRQTEATPTTQCVTHCDLLEDSER